MSFIGDNACIIMFITLAIALTGSAFYGFSTVPEYGEIVYCYDDRGNEIIGLDCIQEGMSEEEKTQLMIVIVFADICLIALGRVFDLITRRDNSIL